MSNNIRTSLIKKNIIASFILKGWSAVVVLLMVPLTLKMLGVYTNGVWLTVSGLLLWIDMLDIGLGNGLRNAVAKYIAEGNTQKVREAVSSTLFMLFVIVIPLFLAICGLLYFLDIYYILGVKRQAIPGLEAILTTAAALTCGTFILKSIGNFYMGLQLPAVNNLVVCSGQMLALLLTFLAYLLGSRSLFFVLVINTASPLLAWLVCLPVTFRVKYPQYRPALRFINLQMSRSLCSTGLQFFILQICSVILLTSTNVIISKMFSPSEVTPYQVAYRYFSIILVAFNTICMPFWNATTDAYSRGDMDWIYKNSHKLDLLVLFSLVSLACMIAVSGLVYKAWIGSSVYIPIELTVSMAVYIFILITSLRYSYILNGLNVLHIQLVFTIFATVVFLPLAWFACKSYGTVTSLVYVMSLVNLPGLFANMWKYKQIFNKKK